MPHAQLTLSVPEETWIHEVSTGNPEATFQVIAVLNGTDTGIALLEILTEKPVPIIAQIQAHDEIVDFDLLWKRRETTMAQIETTSPVLLLPLITAGIPLQTPFEVRDGNATWEITTSSSRLSEFGTRLDEADISFDAEFVQEEASDSSSPLLTDRQREVLLSAVEAGYYDTPRRATLTEVSESLDISKATGSDVLHRAEGAVLKWFVEHYPTPEQSRYPDKSAKG